MKPEILILQNTDEIADKFATQLLELADKAIEKTVHVALSGGSTPKAVFKILEEKYGIKLAKPQFHFWWGDDRCVLPTNNESNYKWAYELWLKPIGIQSKNIHRIHGENEPLHEAKRYAEEINEFVKTENGIPIFDYILLGLGEDGHTASIFPNQMELLDSKEICAVAIHPESQQKRISFTGKLINNAKRVVFLTTGSNKAQIVSEIINNKNQKLPATHIKTIKGNLIWMLDKEAARLS